MNEQLRLRFSGVMLESKDKLQQIDCLRYMIDSEEVTDFEDVGFCYWNISDNFALLRDGQSLFLNHQAFYEHIKKGNTCYLYWLVCDATQRLTLEINGHSEFWWSLYQEAVCHNANNDYHFIEFCVHRAALYVNPMLPHTKHNLVFAKENYENLLNKTRNMPEYTFYKVIYYSLMSRFSPLDSVELKSLCEMLYDGLSCDVKTNNFLLGEWDSFVIPFDRYKQSEVGINSLINAFIYNNELQIAKELYSNACALGMKKNNYIESRLR